MTRFHLALAVTLIVVAGAWFLAVPWLVWVALSLFAILFTLGVAVPRMRFFGPFICHGHAEHKLVALTFDDGPDAESTPALLDLLKASGVPATFFCIGRQVTAHPAIAARMVREGHLVANHSFAHSHGMNFFTLPRLLDDLQAAQDAIVQAASVRPEFFRPPIGLSNPRIFAAARQLGLKVIGWSARGIDTQITNPERVVHRILRQLRPGAIILLHDGNIPAPRVLATVRLLLDALHARGYEVVRLDRLLT